MRSPAVRTRALGNMRGLMGRAVPILALFSGLAGAADQKPHPPSPPPAPPPVPYSIPWQLRPAAVGNVLRFDSSFGSWRDEAGRSGSTSVIGLLGSWKLSTRAALLARVAVVRSHPPTAGTEKRANPVSNPLLGVTFLGSRPGGRRGALLFAAALPFGSGGGGSPRPGQSAALARAIATRSAMDNALFAVNYFTLIGGVSAARVTPGATIQIEATVLELLRARGPQTQDKARTNFTAGVHLGRSLSPRLSAAVELRYQRWLSNAAPVRADGRARETLTLAAGPRLHFRLGRSRWIRPGLSFSLPLDEPLSGQRYRMLQVDVPVSF